MKKLFVSFLIMLSVVLFSACSFNNNNTKSNTVDQSVIENNKNDRNDKFGKRVVPTESKNDLLALSTAPNQKNEITSKREENGIIYNTGEKTQEDGSKVRYNETAERKSPESMVVKRTYDDGKKVIMLIKVKDNKRYAKFYVLYPDGTKDTSEMLTIKNEDGSFTNKYIKEPKTGNFL